MKKALLLAGGEVTAVDFDKIGDMRFDVIIAADGGLFNAVGGNYVPDFVIGDLDSVSGDMESRYPQTKFIRQPSQELNDLEKALIFCEGDGITDITLLGIGGKRLDHTLNNLSVLTRYDRKFRLTIYDKYSQIFLVRRDWRYSGDLNQLVSLIPLGRVENVTTRGLAFPLDRESLVFGQREGLSNFIVSNPVHINTGGGILFVYVIDPAQV